MNSDLKVGAEPMLNKDTDEKDNRPDSPEQTEDTSDNKRSEDTHEESIASD